MAVADACSGMTVAADTREAVRATPFLYDALRAGVVNYTAAARHLDVGEPEAVAAALRRFADELSAVEPPAADARVSMESGLGRTDDSGLFTLGETSFASGAGSLTGILARGEVSPAALRELLGRLAAEEIAVEAAGVAGDALLVVVDRRAGPDAVQILEAVVA
jgi:hypothetical protein